MKHISLHCLRDDSQVWDSGSKGHVFVTLLHCAGLLPERLLTVACPPEMGAHALSSAHRADATCSTWRFQHQLPPSLMLGQVLLELRHIVGSWWGSKQALASPAPAPSPASGSQILGHFMCVNLTVSTWASMGKQPALLQLTLRHQGHGLQGNERPTQAPMIHSLLVDYSRSFWALAWPCSPPLHAHLLNQLPALLASGPQQTWGQHTEVDYLVPINVYCLMLIIDPLGHFPDGTLIYFSPS